MQEINSILDEQKSAKTHFGIPDTFLIHADTAVHS